ncbi:MAG: 4-hydroxy-3-methylbut-2-enyl diphosphate reductase [Lachnospiraceae bacterium]|nr:4-hydroxy-3-methylbut-2-enyl diphosphate reductase [Lachnospiraceae bacterium]
MEVKVAKTAGFCFGVKRAVKLVYDEIAREGSRVYTMGPIIHNEQVVGDLADKGVHIINDDLFCEEEGRYPGPGDVIIVRSHGVSREMTEKLKRTGARIVSAACPFVTKIHEIVAEKSREGCHVVIIGDPKHPEVEGIRGWASSDCTVIENCEEAQKFHVGNRQKVWIVSQTTFNYEKFQELVEIIKSLGYDIVVTNTICNATKERQIEAMELARNSDAMIVIGGRHSSNTQKLYDICRDQCKNTYYIQTLDDLVTVNFQSESCVGITAGASTPNTIIQEVVSNVRRTKL